MVFDPKGRLIKANTSAERILAAVGVELSRVPRLRVDVLDTSSAAPGQLGPVGLGVSFTHIFKGPRIPEDGPGHSEPGPLNLHGGAA